MTELSVYINNSIVSRKNGQDIFQNSLLLLVDICGEDKVISADIERNCISRETLRRQVHPKKIGNYYISTHHGNSGKASRLNKLNERLNDVSIVARALDS